MNRNSTHSVGALHPILFFLVVYGISLFLALFVCRTVYYSINGEEATIAKEATPKTDNMSFTTASMTATALR